MTAPRLSTFLARNHFLIKVKFWNYLTDLTRPPCRIKNPFILELLKGPGDCIEMFEVCMEVEQIKWYRRKAEIYCKEFTIELYSLTAYSKDYVTLFKLSHFLTQLQIIVKFKKLSRKKSLAAEIWCEGPLPDDETYKSFASFFKNTLGMDPYLFTTP